MTIGEAVRYRILQLCEERNLSVNKLSSISGVTQSTVNNIISGRNHSTTVSRAEVPPHQRNAAYSNVLSALICFANVAPSKRSPA